MVDVTVGADKIETQEDLGEGEAAKYAFWQAQEKIAEKEERKWVKQAREIIKRYRDERPANSPIGNRFNILWSNVQTLIPTLYARTPKPDVERRFRDADPVGRLAATLLERCLNYSVDAFNFDAVMRSVVEDRLLPGRGVARVLYVPHFGEPIKEEGEENEYDSDEDDNPEFADAEAGPAEVDNPGDKGAEEIREVVFEEVRSIYVYWEDYLEGPARQWPEVPWIRYRSFMTRDELVTRFGNKGKDVNLDYTPRGGTELTRNDSPPDIYKKAVVHEVWDKANKRVCWYAPGTPDIILDEQDDPLELMDFFPNPDPVLATTSNDKRVPVPDYIEYQDQARELDTLTSRIDRLTRALKVSGIYAGEEKQVFQQLIDEGTENRLIPVEDAAAWADKGGIANMIQWMPVQQIAETIIQLYNARDRVKATLYEVTGIGDIMRGSTNPNETLGAQELKANFATRRIVPQQKEIARFARDIFRLMGGVIAGHFSARTISMMTGYPQLDPVPPLPPMPQRPQQMLPAPALMAASPPNPQAPEGAFAQGAPPDPAQAQYQQAMAQWMQAAKVVQAITQKNQEKQQQFDAAVALIKQDGAHGFRIDIEADSTIAPDEQAEKQARIEFMQQFVPFMEQVVPIAMGNPAMADMAKELTMFVMRGFKVSRPLEETVEKAFAALAQMPQNPKVTGQDKAPKGPQGAAPAELALQAKESEADAVLRSKETDTKLQIARETNATRLAETQSRERIAAAQLGATNAHKQAEHMLERDKLDDQVILHRDRELNALSQSAKNLQ